MATATRDLTFAEYVRETQTLPEEVTLGNLIWFTVSEEKSHPVSREQLEQDFATLGLNSDYLPFPNRPVDAFKKATTDAQRPERDDDYSLPDGKRFNILIRDVSSDKEKIVRHIILEVVDSGNVRLSHDKVGEAVFYHAPYAQAGKRAPKGHRMLVRIDGKADLALGSKKLERIRERIQASYEHDCRYIDSQKLRAMVRDYLLHLNAVALKPSVYFVHKARTDEVARLATLVERFGNGSSVFFMPMPDLEKVRVEVIERFQTEAAQQVENLIKEIAEVRSSRKRITPEICARFQARWNDVAGKAKEHTRTLGLTQDRTASILELAMESLMELQEAASDQLAGV
jgi:hypothetical protein